MKSSRCVEDKSEEVTRLLKVLVKTYKASNTNLINDRTYAACIDLHSKDENAAILNETCRDIFEAKFHPDFEMESLFDRFDKLTDAAETLDRQKIEIQAELDKLNGIEIEDYLSFEEAMQEALMPCD